jgi:hypothetical protein
MGLYPLARFDEQLAFLIFTSVASQRAGRVGFQKGSLRRFAG